MSTTKKRPAPQNRGQKSKSRGQTKRKRRQGGKGKPFVKGQPDLPVGQRFEPGQSGNPGGRPATLKEVREFFQVDGLEYAKALRRIALGESQRQGRLEVFPAFADQRQSIRDVFDRTFGRTLQTVEITGAGGGPLETRDIALMNSAERRARLNELLTKAGAGVTVATDEPAGEAAEDGEADEEEAGPERD